MHAPLWTIALTIWLYWTGVLIMAAVIRWRFQRPAGLVARMAGEKWLFRIWLPVIVLWNALPAIALHKDDPPWSVPDWAIDGVMEILRWGASVFGVVMLLLTVTCWITMGRAWSMAVVEHDEQRLVTTGLYRLARHPIYAMSIWLMVATVVVLPTWPMALVAASHLILMNLKARNEERQLRTIHGDTYVEYMQRTGRFWPGWRL